MSGNQQSTLVNKVTPSLVVRRKHPVRWGLAAVIVLVAAFAVQGAVTNERFGWEVVGEYLFAQPILDGVGMTLYLTAVSMVIGVVLGAALALMRTSANPVLSTAAWGYIWFFRGTPLLVQLIFWFNLSALFPELGLGLPFGPTLVDIDANILISGVTAAILGLGLNEAAYMAEIMRSGILSVDEGQREAATALSISRSHTLRYVVLPQAMRVIIPPTGNQTIGMLKTTSIVSVVAVAELLFASQLIYARTFETIPLLIVASAWYLFMTSVLSIGQYYVERHYSRGAAVSNPSRFRFALRNRTSATEQIGQDHE